MHIRVFNIKYIIKYIIYNIYNYSLIFLISYIYYNSYFFINLIRDFLLFYLNLFLKFDINIHNSIVFLVEYTVVSDNIDANIYCYRRKHIFDNFLNIPMVIFQEKIIFRSIPLTSYTLKILYIL